jgi:hypothetical protein
MAKTMLGIGIAFTLMITGSALADHHAKKKAPAASAQNIGGVDDAKGGTISGVVKYSGKLVKRKPVNMAGNAQCNQFHKGNFPQHERWVFGKTKDGKSDTLANVLVYVSKGLEGKKFAAPKKAALLNQKGCRYEPHVLAIMVGQPLEIANSDAWMHNVTNNGLAENNDPFNVAMPFVGKLKPMKFKKELKMAVRCSVHPWMEAYIHVLDHPYFAITGADGSFTIKGLPAGKYEVSVLHEMPIFAAEKPALEVTSEGGKTTKLEFTFSPKKRKK